MLTKEKQRLPWPIASGRPTPRASNTYSFPAFLIADASIQHPGAFLHRKYSLEGQSICPQSKRVPRSYPNSEVIIIIGGEHTRVPRSTQNLQHQKYLQFLILKDKAQHLCLHLLIYYIHPPDTGTNLAKQVPCPLHIQNDHFLYHKNLNN